MKKVLIIEDDQIVANIYRNKFTVEGYQVEIALDGEAGLELIKSFRPDAVILDLMLPKITGVELMKKIRAEPDFENLPLIVFSNTYLSNMVQEAWKAGATKCLSKANCTPRQVIEVVRSTTGGNGQPHAVAGATQTAQPQPASTAPRTSAPAGKTASEHADEAFQVELRKSFIESLPATLGILRTSLKSLIKSENEAERLKAVIELHRRIRALTGNAGIAGMLPIAQMSDALEALLRELYEKPKTLNASTMRTVATAIDFLGALFDQASRPQREIPKPRILVVDDEAISRRAITHALEKAKLGSINVEDPNVAYKMLSEQAFDLVFLDVDMPGMNGFELCTKLRALPAHKKTAVVFVTSLNDLESRASSMMSGGNDFIGKPFLFIELAVKALVYVLRGKLETSKRPATA
jgi:DNA-binding response OmpR family regulator